LQAISFPFLVSLEYHFKVCFIFIILIADLVLHFMGPAILGPLLLRHGRSKEIGRHFSMTIYDCLLDILFITIIFALCAAGPVSR
jgi:hypothetical protein